MIAPVGINAGNIRIRLDESESQMIEGGPHLIEHFAGQQVELSRSRFRNIQLLFALRLGNDFIRLTGGVRGDASLDSAEMFLSPDEFKLGGFDPGNHNS